MPLMLSWQDILLRLALTILAGGVIGLNRTEHGRPAGLRTTILVGLAACVAMLQANLLLPTGGKTGSSFSVMDIMRMPLGILTGMGFIGAGAILRRGDRVLGVTTAATLWLVTVIGLCFGGGQITLGLISAGLAAVILWGLKWLELIIPEDLHGTLLITTAPDGPSDRDLRNRLFSAGYKIKSFGATYSGPPDRRQATLRYDVQWKGRLEDDQRPSILQALSSTEGVELVRWKQ